MLGNHTNSTITDKLKQNLTNKRNTTNRCRNTTESSFKATKGSGQYLHNNNGAK